MRLAEEKHEEITLVVKCRPNPHSSEQQKTVEVPVDFNLGDFRREAQEVFGIHKTCETVLMRETTQQLLSDDKTFRSAALQNNAVLVLIYNIGCS